MTAPTLVEGRYRLVERLGNGGTNVVYRADDLVLGRSVALKVMHATSARDEIFLGTFEREVGLLTRVRHSNVAPVHAFGPNGSSFYLAMDHVEGKTLAASIEEHSARGELVPLDRALSIIRDVGRALAVVHAIGVVHRDVKPSNIVIEESTGRAVLVGFGLSCRRTSTRFYTAPEQISDVTNTSTSGQSDLYSLACTAFELLTGKPVFTGTDELDTLRRHFATTPPRLSSRRRELAPLDDLLTRALAKEPDERQAGCDAFVQELEIAARKLAARLAKRDGSTRLLRVALLETDDALARQIGSIVERELRSAGDDADIDRLDDVDTLGQALAVAPPHVLIIDTENAGEVDATIERVLAGTNDCTPEIILLRRAFHIDARTKPHPRLTELPKPINARVLGAVVGKLSARRLRTCP